MLASSLWTRAVRTLVVAGLLLAVGVVSLSGGAGATGPSLDSPFYKDRVLATGPLGYWGLGETTGPAVDHSTSGINGTFGSSSAVTEIRRGEPGPSITGKWDEGVFAHDMSNLDNGPHGPASVQVPDAYPGRHLWRMSGNQPFSVNIWVKWNGYREWRTYGVHGGIIGDVNFNVNLGGWSLETTWGDTTSSPTHILFRRNATRDDATDTVVSPNDLPLGQWKMITAVYTGMTQLLYEDGVLVASHADPAPLNGGTDELLIGVQNYTTYLAAFPAHFEGTLDEAAIWDRALSGIEISKIFTGPAALPQGQTLGWQGGALANNPTYSQAEPVNTATGSYWTSATDLSLPGICAPFTFTRGYNSLDTASGSLGIGWTDNLAASLTLLAAGDIQARGEDGQLLLFKHQQDGSYAPPAGALVTLTAAAGGYELVRTDQTKYAFDSQGRLTAVRDNNDCGPTLSYGPDGLLASATDSAGRTITFTNTDGLLTRIDLPDGRYVTYGYTAGKLTSVHDLRGGTTAFEYDAGDRLNKITDQNGHIVVRNTYGSDGRVTQQIDARGDMSTFGWDPATTTATYTDARGKTWTDVYSNNALAEQIDPLGNSTKYEYDTEWNVLKVTDPRGNATTMTYDDRNNMLTRTAPAPLSYQEVNTYDGANHLLTSRDGRGNTTTYGYDAAGNLTTVTQPGSLVTTFERDPSGNGQLKSVTDARGKKTSFVYDVQGNLTQTTSPLGNVTKLGFDSVGRMTSRIEPRGNVAGANPADYTMAYTYDAADHVLTATDPLAGRTTWEYDPAGNLASVTDANLHKTQYGYDAANHQTSVTAPDLTVTQYTYDPVGNLLTRTDAKTHQTTYTYDDANRLASTTSPIGQKWTYGYDGAGDLATVVDAAGNATPAAGDGQTTLSYDELNRVKAIDYSDATPDVTFAYDANGNRTQMTDGSGTETSVYDAVNRLQTLTRGTNTFQYGYDAAGNVISRTYPDNTLVTYVYDDDDRLSSVTNGTASTSYGYDEAAELIRRTLPATNGYVETRTYDRAGRLTLVKHQKGTTVLNQAAYALDAVGNPAAITRTAGPENYKYDALDRLTEVCYKVSCPKSGDPYIRWTYDAVGNRLTENRAGKITNYTYNNADQLTGRAGNGGTVAYLYDANGNQTKAGTRTFAYDLANRLKSTTSGSSTIGYLYDGDGKRLKETAGTTVTNLLWDPNYALPQLAVERNGSNALLRRYLYGADLLSEQTPAGSFYYHADALGSVTNMTNATGMKQWTDLYEPFGLVKSEKKDSGSAPVNPMRFAGQYLDSATALYHMRARQYDPTVGRFTRTDPLPQPLVEPHLSAYSYADDRPTVLIDPSGLAGDKPWSFDIGFSGHFIVGFSGGFQIDSNGIAPYGGVGIGLDAGVSASFSNSSANSGIYGNVIACEGYACASVNTKFNVSAGAGLRAGVSADVRGGYRIIRW